ncbi:4115_t:CDS:2 [Acaulospora colombiana]|uniref:4115_t:CDS:1 n=1 Tax=Acaulospora colombiana TaxID=27376 RepID=A0ACA9NPY6_9GLOM|nr:4115_t:CDS:2 [Acaulospora colombiana]
MGDSQIFKKENLVQELMANTTLVMALCNDIDSISSNTLINLRKTLDELAAHAIEDNSATITIHSDIAVTNRSEDITEMSSSLSSMNISQSETIGPPMEFLQAAFPSVSGQTLQEIIRNSPEYNESIDMEAIVEEILSRELKESLQESYMNEGSPSTQPDSREIALERKKKGRKRKSANVVERIVIGDVRHRQVAQAKKHQATEERIDPWSQLASLAEYLSTILSSSPQTFLSLFHSPQHATPFQALCAHIDTLQAFQISETDMESKLSLLFDILAVESDQQQLELEWAQRCLRATEGKILEAIDLYRVLEGLEQSSPIVHQELPSPLDEKLSTTTGRPTKTVLDIRPRAIPHPRSETWYGNEGGAQRRSRTGEWSFSRANRVPTYHGRQALPAWTTSGSSVNDVAMHRAVEQEWREKRAEALRKASQHWQRSQNGYGRQVAAFYAEEAKKYLQQSRGAAIEAARALVIQNRERGKALGFHQAQNIVDLHGMTRDEALFIARETLSTRAHMPDGKHSVGNRGVLSPMLLKALRSEGWKVKEIEAGIMEENTGIITAESIEKASEDWEVNIKK